MPFETNFQFNIFIIIIVIFLSFSSYMLCLLFQAHHKNHFQPSTTQTAASCPVFPARAPRPLLAKSLLRLWAH